MARGDEQALDHGLVLGVVQPAVRGARGGVGRGGEGAKRERVQSGLSRPATTRAVVTVATAAAALGTGRAGADLLSLRHRQGTKSATNISSSAPILTAFPPANSTAIHSSAACPPPISVRHLAHIAHASPCTPPRPRCAAHRVPLPVSLPLPLPLPSDPGPTPGPNPPRGLRARGCATLRITVVVRRCAAPY